MDIISTVSSAVTTVKTLSGFISKINDVKFETLLSDLSMHLAEVKTKLSEVMIENSELKKEIYDLKNEPKASQEMIFKNDAYYTQAGEGPFCISCWDVMKRKSRLSRLSSDFKEAGTHQCPACNHLFHIGDSV